MAIVGGALGYNLLKAYAGQSQNDALSGAAYVQKSKLETLLGRDYRSWIRGKTVIDFGCGTGDEAVTLYQDGAERVIGIDIQERLLNEGRGKARERGISDQVHFSTSTTEKADVLIALDSFEHFEDPEGVLQTMSTLIKPDGVVVAAFGPTWFHPYGGHLFSVFPWAHLLFSEKALLRWRSDFKTDGATRFSEVDGGLNQMTVGRFRKIVERSPFKVRRLEAVPIRKLRRIAHPLTEEFTTAIVRCTLKLH